MRKSGLGPGVSVLMTLLAALVVVTTSSAAHRARPAPIKAAWIYVGPHNDGGWSQTHDQGRLSVQKKLGANVITTYKENVPEGPQAARVIDSLVRAGNKIIFATSFAYMDVMVAAAKKYPDVYFEHATGYKSSRNLANYFGAFEDVMYLSGMAAGAATKNGKVGMVVPVAIPETIRHVNAFALGVQTTHPGATIKLAWTRAWFDLAREKKAAERLVAAGVDVIGQGVDGGATGQYAESKGIPWVGSRATAGSAAPSSWLTSGKYDWGGYYLDRTKQAANGTWKTGSYYGSLEDGFAVLEPYGPKVSPKTKALIAAKRAAIISGKYYEFQGPLYDQSGKVRVAKGKRMTLPQILSFDWLVRGVEGSPKG